MSRILHAITEWSLVDSGAAVAVQDFSTRIALKLALRAYHIVSLELEADGFIDLPFGELQSAAAFSFESTRACSLQITSTDGAEQAITALALSLVTDRNPFTAIRVARAPGVPTKIRVFLGEN